MNNYEKAKEIVKKYGQEKLLYFYNELDKKEKEILVKQILEIDFEEILNLYKRSYDPKSFEVDLNTVTPIPHIEREKIGARAIQKYESIAEKVISKNQVAVVTMAGGQGTRLGYKGPKGTYELKINHHKKSLYEILCEDLKKTNEKYGITLNWYIMTSTENDEATKKYFEEHNYFNYPKENIKFFLQGNLPLITIDGELFLREPYIVKEASNGNGDVFKAMQRAGILDDMKKKKIKYISFGGIDNVLLKNVDPLFLGLMIDKDYQIASKSIFKKEPMDNIAVYCLKNNRPAILDYDDITEDLTMKKFKDGTYCYREINMVSHIMTLKAVQKAARLKLPYHRAFKKNAFVNEEGMKQVPDGPNSFKFETFIFDAFAHFDDMLLLRVEEAKEFAPIKSFNGKFTPETAVEKYLKSIDF